MVLENYIRNRQQQRDILLMTHIVLGYPSLDASLRIVDAMVTAGVDLMELQIPFSEPIADGPVILRANQLALQQGISLDQCFATAEAICSRFDIPFLFMSYYNLLYRRGLAAFTDAMVKAGLQGAIVPDLPPEEAGALLTEMNQRQLAPIFIFAPNSTEARLRQIAQHSSGLVYCVARKGVTGSDTAFSTDLAAYLARCRAATNLPLAVGFGVKDADDVAFLRGKADIAVVGSQTIRLIDEQGLEAVGPFIRSLRPD